MSFKKNKKIVLYINPNQVVLYGSNIKNLATIPLNTDIIRDLEIVNEELFEKTLSTFLQTNKILPASVVVIVANSLIFSKNFPPVSPQYSLEKQKAEIEAFLTYVPFQSPLEKIITTPKGTSVIVANGRIYEVIRQVCEPLDFPVEGMAPLAYVEPSSGEMYSARTAQSIFNKLDWVKQNGFTITEPEELPTSMVEESDEKKKNSKRTAILVGFFIFLLLVLGGLLYYQQQTNKKLPQAAVTLTTTAGAAASTAPTVLPSPSIASDSARVNRNVSIQILNGSGIPGEADLFRTQLEDAGFTNVRTGNAPSLTLSRTLVVFSPAVTQDTRNLIIAEAQKKYGEISTQESSTIQSDVIITSARTAPTAAP